MTALQDVVVAVSEEVVVAVSEAVVVVVAEMFHSVVVAVVFHRVDAEAVSQIVDAIQGNLRLEDAVVFHPVVVEDVVDRKVVYVEVHEEVSFVQK